jgi:hypothetical protein
LTEAGAAVVADAADAGAATRDSAVAAVVATARATPTRRAKRLRVSLRDAKPVMEFEPLSAAVGSATRIDPGPRLMLRCRADAGNGSTGLSR